MNPTNPMHRCALVGALVAMAACGGGEGPGAVALEPVERAGRSTTTSTAETDERDGEVAVDEALADRLVEVEGFTFVSADPPTPFEVDVLKIGREAPLHSFSVTAPDGTSSRLTLVAPADGVDATDFESDTVERFFHDTVDFIAGEPVESGDQVVVATNRFPPEWVGVADEFVMHAYNEPDDEARWEWFHDELLWIVEGPAAVESTVAALVTVQHELAAPDPYDVHLLAGELEDRFPPAPLFYFWHQDRSTHLRALAESVLAPCQERYLVFAVTDERLDPALGGVFIGVEAAVIEDSCDGLTQFLHDSYTALAGSRTETIAGIDVITTATEMVWVEDGIAFHVQLYEPANRARFQPFIDEYVRHQADLPAAPD